MVPSHFTSKSWRRLIFETIEQGEVEQIDNKTYIYRKTFRDFIGYQPHFKRKVRAVSVIVKRNALCTGYPSL